MVTKRVSLRKQRDRKCQRCCRSQQSYVWWVAHDSNFRISRNTKEGICTDFTGCQNSSYKPKRKDFFKTLDRSDLCHKISEMLRNWTHRDLGHWQWTCRWKPANCLKVQVRSHWNIRSPPLLPTADNSPLFIHPSSHSSLTRTLKDFFLSFLYSSIKT